MLELRKKYLIKPDFSIDLEWSMNKAQEALNQHPLSITDVISPMGKVHINEYYSNGDYWWPDPDKKDGLPYIRRDGESNPDAFMYHRFAIRKTRTAISHLTRAYMHTKDEIYAEKAVELLKLFFINEDTKMMPHLLYAQALPGICSGRGIGIIDTLHITDIPFALEVLKKSNSLTNDIYNKMVRWFEDYLEWMTTHQHGFDESNEPNNHGICYYVQVAVFALFTENTQLLEHCREMFFKKVIVQMNKDGGFDKELARTKPYGYSLFVLDNFITLCHVLSDKKNNFWEYKTTDGRCARKANEFMIPYIKNKEIWPYKKDVEYFDDYPSRMSFMVFGGYVLGIKELIQIYQSLPEESYVDEVRRNTTIRQPFLWI